MQRIFGPLALAAAALGLTVLIAGPDVNPLSGSRRVLSEAPAAYNAWALGLLMGLLLAWLATRDWGKFPEWLQVQHKRIGLVVLGGLFATVLLLF
jgi:hypothetical protein